MKMEPCPHCGVATARVVKTSFPDPGEPDLYTVHCGYCGARSGNEETEAEAISAWNRRPPSPATQREPSEGEVEAASAASKQVWQNWPEPIDTTNVADVSRAAISAALRAAYALREPVTRPEVGETPMREPYGWVVQKPSVVYATFVFTKHDRDTALKGGYYVTPVWASDRAALRSLMRGKE